MKSRVIYIHGLFGEESLSPSKYITEIINPYNLETVEELNLKDGDCVYAYSLGARVLLKRIIESNFKLPNIKINILSAHIHLEQAKNKEREIYENKLIKKMRGYDFEAYWNSLSIFSRDIPININTSKMSEYIDIFKKYRLSEQISSKKYLEQNPSIFQIFWGDQDHKIKKQYQDTNVNIKKGFYQTSHRGILSKIDIIHEQYN